MTVRPRGSGSVTHFPSRQTFFRSEPGHFFERLFEFRPFGSRIFEPMLDCVARGQLLHIPNSLQGAYLSCVPRGFTPLVRSQSELHKSIGPACLRSRKPRTIPLSVTYIDIHCHGGRRAGIRGAAVAPGAGSYVVRRAFSHKQRWRAGLATAGRTVCLIRALARLISAPPAHSGPTGSRGR